MCNLNINEEKIISDIKIIVDYATNMKHDGWTQNFYREKLKKIVKEIENIDKGILKLHGE